MGCVFARADADASRPLALQSSFRSETTAIPTDALLDLARKEVCDVGLAYIHYCPATPFNTVGPFCFNHPRGLLPTIPLT